MRPPRGPLLFAAIAGALLVAILAAYWPVLGHGFVFDDFALIVDNPGIKGLDAAHLRWMFSSTYLTTYHPLGWAALACVHAAAGLSPAAFHAANLVGHWLVALALFAFARRLLTLAGAARPDAASFAAALLFAVHPFQVNTVAWAIELPDILSTLFFLLAAFVYLGRSRAAWAWAFALYAVSLLFRWKSLSLPLLLVGLDYWPLGRLRARPGDPFDKDKVRIWAEKAPFVILAVAAASLTALAKSREVYAPSIDPFAAARALWLYAGLLLKPWGYRAAYALHGGGFVALPLAMIAAAAAWRFRRTRPWLLLAGVAYASAALPPALGAQNGAVFVYAAYGYLACLGFFVLAGAAAAKRPVAALILAAAFVTGTRLELRHWKEPVSFWTRAVEVDPGFSPARGQLGAALLAVGRPEEAFVHLAARLADAPDDLNAAADMDAVGRAAPALKEEAARAVARAASIRSRLP